MVCEICPVRDWYSSSYPSKIDVDILLYRDVVGKMGPPFQAGAQWWCCVVCGAGGFSVKEKPWWFVALMLVFQARLWPFLYFVFWG